MINQCAAPKCKTGYDFNHQIATSHFPMKKTRPKKWIPFFIELIGTQATSVIFEEHFIDCTQKYSLKWQLDLVSTIYSAELLRYSVAQQSYSITFTNFCN